ncbi:MAG: hypothetical protein HONBIEJF_02948 [Fimbriimonadaceae bacterium]|nr:hypothetical protein [Fimbriimonadaceae bacterium]
MTPSTTALIVGVVLGGVVWGFGRLVGLDRERAYYATILAVVALYYALFAVMGRSMEALLLESIAIAVFFVLTALGFRRSQWIVAAGLAGHGLYDAVHGALISNPGMPVWWPYFCGSIDVTMAVGLAAILVRQERSATSVIGEPAMDSGEALTRNA